MRYQQSSKQSVPAKAVSSSAPRGNKTLGWFLDNDIFEKKGAQAKNEKLSCKPNEEKKKRRGPRKAHKKSLEVGSEGSAMSEDGSDEMKKQLSDAYAASKEDYIVYDIASDGYYYEQGSARGWRRRQTNSVGPVKSKDQEVDAKTLSNKSLGQSQLQLAATRALLQAVTANPSPYRYYDPSSDGYFYEMASVDGWKKRVPNQGPRTPSGVTPTNSATTSYGAALAKGQMPKNCIIDDSSASSSVSEDFPQAEFVDMSSRTFRMPRPSSLTWDQFLPSFNADKFIQDLSFSGIDHAKMFGGTGTPTPQGDPFWDSEKLDSEDVALGNLLKGLENIWTNPS